MSLTAVGVDAIDTTIGAALLWAVSPLNLPSGVGHIPTRGGLPFSSFFLPLDSTAQATPWALVGRFLVRTTEHVPQE